MAYRYTTNSSPFRYSIRDILLHFRQTISKEAGIALEERDAALRRDNEALLAEIRSLKGANAEHYGRNRWLEEELSKMRKIREVEVADFGEKERWLQKTVLELEEKGRNEKARLEGKLRKLEEAIAGLKKEKGEFEHELDRLKSKRNDEDMDRVLKEKVARISELFRRNDDLEKEKRKAEVDLCKVKIENERLEGEVKEMHRLAQTVQVLKTEKGVMEAEIRKVKNKKISEHVKRTEVLEREKAELEAEVCKAKNDKSNESGRISELLQKNDLLQKEKREVEDEVRRLKSDAKVNEFRRVSNDRLAALEAKKTELCRRVCVLEKEKMETEADLCKKNVEIGRILKEKMDLETQNKRLEEEKGVMEADFQKTISEKNAEIERILNEKVDLEVLSSRMEAGLKKEICELVNQIRVLEERKSRAEECVNKEHSKLVEAEKALEVQVTEFGRIWKEKMALETQNNILEKENVRILNEKVDVEVLKNRMEAELKEEIHQLVDWVKVLEERKRRVEECVNEEGSKLVEAKKALEVQMMRAEEAEKHVSDILETIRELEKVEEAKVLKAAREKREVIVRILNQKMVLEDEMNKKISGYVRRIEVLEREKKELETKFCRADKEKSEEIQRILNENKAMEAEKRAVKDGYEKKNLELANRISILESEKRGLEAEIVLKDEAIKVLDKENTWLEDVKKELEKEINVLASKSKVDVCLKDNVGTLSNSWQNEGKNSAVVAHSSEQNQSSNHNVDNRNGNHEDGMTLTNGCKRKRPIIKCEELDKKNLKPECEHLSTSTEINSTRRTNGSNGGEVKVAFEWEVDQDLLDAFDVSPELCLKAVCALYRQHERLLDSTNASVSPGARVFKPEHSDQAVSLAKYLIFEDPEGRRMKKLVAKLDKFNPLAVDVCRDIAKQHYKQVFEIYKKKEEPLFLS